MIKFFRWYKFSQNWSSVDAPANKPSMPMTAISSPVPSTSERVPGCLNWRERDLVAGTFSISVQGQDGARTSRKGVRLAAGISEDLGDFTVEHDEVFSGRVTYPDGKPVQGLAMRSSSVQATKSGPCV